MYIGVAEWTGGASRRDRAGRLGQTAVVSEIAGPPLLVNYMRPGGGWRRFRRPSTVDPLRPTESALQFGPDQTIWAAHICCSCALHRHPHQTHRLSPRLVVFICFLARPNNESSVVQAPSPLTLHLCGGVTVARVIPRQSPPRSAQRRSFRSFFSVAMSLARYCLLPLLFISVCVHARPHKRATDYFDNSPYGSDEGIAIDFVTIAHTSATVEPRKSGGDVKTNRINSFMSTLSQLNDSSGVVQWFRSVW